jgi:hypothetical protein
VDYTSSAGLRVLLAVVKEARSRGGDVRLAAVRDNVQSAGAERLHQHPQAFPRTSTPAVASFGA